MFYLEHLCILLYYLNLVLYSAISATLSFCPTNNSYFVLTGIHLLNALGMSLSLVISMIKIDSFLCLDIIVGAWKAVQEMCSFNNDLALLSKK